MNVTLNRVMKPAKAVRYAARGRPFNSAWRAVQKPAGRAAAARHVSSSVVNYYGSRAVDGAFNLWHNRHKHRGRVRGFFRR